MAMKITKTDDKRIGQALEKLGAARTALESAVEDYNDVVRAARAALQLSIDAHDEAAQEVRGLVEDIHREAEEEFDGKSEKWQDGDKGAAAREWLDALESFVGEIEDADVNQLPDDLDPDDILPIDPADAYGELDKEPQE